MLDLVGKLPPLLCSLRCGGPGVWRPALRSRQWGRASQRGCPPRSDVPGGGRETGRLRALPASSGYPSVGPPEMLLLRWQLCTPLKVYPLHRCSVRVSEGALELGHAAESGAAGCVAGRTTGRAPRGGGSPAKW